MRIALDAMGGDAAPAAIVQGALAACRKNPGLTCLLVGRQAELESLLGPAASRPSNLQIVNAADVVGMDEHPVEALRHKKDSSILRTARLVKDGQADGMVSAGNTGAAVAAATLQLGHLEGVKRAGIAAPLPSPDGVAVLIDVGANINCKPIHLFQYALMGSIYYRLAVKSKESPRVGLLNIGSESEKGNVLVRESMGQLARGPVNFVGNIEGQDLFTGTADVIVCEGFLGNVLLKASEGIADLLFRGIGRELARAKVASEDEIRRGMESFKAKVDWAAYGGAPLLGVNGVCIISHGRSDARAIANALALADRLASEGLCDKIVAGLREIGAGVLLKLQE